jgi:mannose-1-phosphate guanylyltransferase
MLHAVIMAGGAGTRFWPASRRNLPKQLLDLAGDESMLQSTLARFAGWVSPDRTLVVTNERLVESVRCQLPALASTSVLGEPCKRDTAPCVGVAAGWVLRDDPEAVMVVSPSDHVISPVGKFREAIEAAARLVEASPETLVTFGIRPTYPAESFGYIQRGDALSEGAYRVERFREKPSAEVAREYVASGDYYWNAGIFVWKARTILDLLRQFEPVMHQHLDAIASAARGADFDEVFRREFAAIVGKSIDYAVMERAPRVVVMEAPFAWDDVGSWQAMSRLRGVDGDGNTCSGRYLTLDTRGTIVRSTADHLVVTLGLEDCLVVHTPDATLVASKHCEERIREVVQRLEKDGYDQYL